MIGRRVCWMGILAVAVTLTASSPRAWSAEVWLWGWEGIDAVASGDTISSGTPIWGEKFYQASTNIWAGTLSSPSITMAPPGGSMCSVWEWSNESMPYYKWDSSAGAFSWTADSLGGSETMLWAEMTPPGAYTDYFTPKVSASRSISNPIMTSDCETRTVTFTMIVGAGSLSGCSELQIDLLNVWGLPEGVEISVDRGSISTPAGFGYTLGDTIRFFPNSPGIIPYLSGTYVFTADVMFTRSGDVSQAAMGDLFLKPGAMVFYGERWDFPYMSGDSRSATLGDAQVTWSADEMFNYSGAVVIDCQKLCFDTIVASPNAAPDAGMGRAIFLKTTTISGDTLYAFAAEFEDVVNVARATITTPNGRVYEMELESDEGQADFVFASDDPADLAAADLVSGNYTLRLYNHVGTVKTLTVNVSGEYPTDTMQFDQALGMETGNVRQGLSWRAPTDPDINIVVLSSDIDDDVPGPDLMLLTLLGDDLATETSWAPDADLPRGGYAFYGIFGAADFTTVEGVEFMTGYATVKDSYFNLRVLPGDANGDGKIDSADLAIWQQNYDPIGSPGAAFSMGDFNGDGKIDSADLAIWQQNYNPIGSAGLAGANVNVPEPATMLMLASGMLGLGAMRKGRCL